MTGPTAKWNFASRNRVLESGPKRPLGNRFVLTTPSGSAAARICCRLRLGWSWSEASTVYAPAFVGSSRASASVRLLTASVPRSEHATCEVVVAPASMCSATW